MFHIKCRFMFSILFNNILMFIFLLVEIWLGVYVMMFLFWKYAKLNIFLICVHKPKTTTKIKQREYFLIYCLNKRKYTLGISLSSHRITLFLFSFSSLSYFFISFHFSPNITNYTHNLINYMGQHLLYAQKLK